MTQDFQPGDLITRTQLYELVWRYETKVLAERFKISGSLVGRLCRLWKIPKPSRGEWQQMQAGQSVKQPDLPAMPGPDPVVLVAGASSGFESRMPRKERKPRPLKKSLAKELSERFAAEQLKEQRAIDDRQAELSAVLWGAADHHMLSVEDWSAACYLEMGMIGPTATFDALSTLTLHCRYEVPAKRRGEPMQVDISIERPRDLDGERDELGWVNYRKRVLSLFMTDADAVAFLSTALSAGRIRTLELEVVLIGRRPSVRWARFGTMPGLAV